MKKNQSRTAGAYCNTVLKEEAKALQDLRHFRWCVGRNCTKLQHLASFFGLGGSCVLPQHW